MLTKPRQRALCAASAMAISAAGFLTIPEPVRADPAIPLPPACQFNGNFVLQQSNGFGVQFSSTGKTAQGTAGEYDSSGNHVTSGNVNGSIDGAHLDFVISWDNGTKGHYTGDVGGDNLAHGITVDQANPGSSANWNSTVPLNCATAPASAIPPAPVPTHVLGRAKPVATVASDVDVYNVKNDPDGAGQIVGVLRQGQQVNLVGHCSPQDWCNVSGAAVPGGTGWVWGALSF